MKWSFRCRFFQLDIMFKWFSFISGYYETGFRLWCGRNPRLFEGGPLFLHEWTDVVRTSEDEIFEGTEVRVIP